MSDFLSLLKIYKIFLHELFCRRNLHYFEINELRLGLEEWYKQYKYMDTHSLASIVWTIINDARCYFYSIADANDLMEEKYPASGLQFMKLTLMQTMVYRNAGVPQVWLKSGSTNREATTQ